MVTVFSRLHISLTLLILAVLLVFNSLHTPALAAGRRLAAPQQLGPADSTIQSGERIRLSWQKVRRATAYQVVVKVEGKTRRSKWLTRTSKMIKVATGRAYSWKVRARVNARVVGRWSPLRVFYAKQKCVVALVPDSLSFEYVGGTRSIRVETNKGQACEWKVSCPVSWLSPGAARGNGPGYFSVKAGYNFSDSRSGKLTIGERVLSVSQESGKPKDAIAPRGEWDFYFKYGGVTTSTKVILSVYESSAYGKTCFIKGGLISSIYGGTWTFIGGNQVRFKFGYNDSYYGYVEAVYEGAVGSNNYMSGEMWNSRNQRGTWYAIRKGTQIVK